MHYEATVTLFNEDAKLSLIINTQSINHYVKLVHGEQAACSIFCHTFEWLFLLMVLLILKVVRTIR